MSWQQLSATAREARNESEIEAGRVPFDCPIDGTLLQESRGVLHCPWCGWRT